MGERRTSRRNQDAICDEARGGPLRGQGHATVDSQGYAWTVLELAVHRQPLGRSPAVHPGRGDGTGTHTRPLQVPARPAAVAARERPHDRGTRSAGRSTSAEGPLEKV